MKKVSMGGVFSFFAVLCLVGVSFAEGPRELRLDESRVMMAKKADLIVDNIDGLVKSQKCKTHT